jgi:hypothetical protein
VFSGKEVCLIAPILAIAYFHFPFVFPNFVKIKLGFDFSKPVNCAKTAIALFRKMKIGAK